MFFYIDTYHILSTINIIDFTSDYQNHILDILMNQDPQDFQEIRDTVMIVKGRFKAVSLNYFGQFIFILKNNKSFDTYNTVVSTYSDLYNLEPHEDWLKYKELIANVKWKGNYNASMTASIIDQIKKFSEEMNSIAILYTNISEYDYNALDVTLFDLINRIVHDKDLILETAIQEISQSEYLAASEGSGPDAEKVEDIEKMDTEGYSVEDGAVILPVKPIVAPVKGKPIYELRVGDKLLVYIQPQSDRANYFIDLLNLRDDGDIRPTAAEVIDIKVGTGKNNPTDILTLISAGIYGKFTEIEKQVKLKMYNPETDDYTSKKKPSPPDQKGLKEPLDLLDKPGFSKGSIVMLVLFLLILALFVILIFLNW